MQQEINTSIAEGDVVSREMRAGGEASRPADDTHVRPMFDISKSLIITKQLEVSTRRQYMGIIQVSIA